MGSLMAGWDSPISPRGDMRRNSSLTKEEVEKFWRSKKQNMEEHLREAMAQQQHAAGEGTSESSSADAVTHVEHRRAVTIPGADGRDVKARESESADFPQGSGDWWTRSSWAFLNEPPQDIRPGQGGSYVPQFDVAARAQLSREMGSSFSGLSAT